MPAAPAPDPCPASDPDRDRAARIARASASVTVLAIDEFIGRLQAMRPPVAYRLSLDSGIEYRNVRRAVQDPRRVRIATWLRLLRSLRVRMVAARCAEDVIWPGDRTLLVVFGTQAGALVAPAAATSLRCWRIARGWSCRDLALRARVCVDAVVSVEGGRGLVTTLESVCEPLGLRLLLALPSHHASLETLWSERAACCLEQPAQYPLRPVRTPADR